MPLIGGMSKVMTSRTSADSIPTDPRSRAIWVKAQLALLNSSYAVVGRKVGLNRRTIAACLYVPHYAAEKALADELGLSTKQLFPERHGRGGQRLHAIRGSKSSGGCSARNVEVRARA